MLIIKIILEFIEIKLIKTKITKNKDEFVIEVNLFRFKLEISSKPNPCVIVRSPHTPKLLQSTLYHDNFCAIEGPGRKRLRCTIGRVKLLFIIKGFIKYMCF